MIANKMTIHDILNYLDESGYIYEFNGNKNTEVQGFSSLTNYRRGSITWIKNKDIKLPQRLYNEVLCAVVQEDVSIRVENGIVSPKSKEVFFAILDHFWGDKSERGICGQNTIIEEGALIDPTVSIGHNCHIASDVIIGEQTIIKNNVSISHASIGSNCTIHSGVVIGTDGFGLVFGDDDLIKRVDHFGRVLIGEDVEIGANACVDRGTIDETVIGRNSKIDNLVHIGHNAVLGESVAVSANAIICGSAVVGKGAYIAPGAIIKNQIKVGAHSLIGMGAVVTKCVNEGMIAAGIPARELRKYRRGDK